MSQSKSKPAGGNPAKTKVYEAPRIIHREPLEAVATACTSETAKGDPAACPTGPINS